MNCCLAAMKNPGLYIQSEDGGYVCMHACVCRLRQKHKLKLGARGKQANDFPDQVALDKSITVVKMFVYIPVTNVLVLNRRKENLALQD